MQDTATPAGRAKGGIARRNSLTAEERGKIARKAAEARWSSDVPNVTFGSPDRPLVLAGREIPCYVLEDGTRILSRAGFIRAIGRTGKAKGGRAHDDELQTPVFLTAENLKPFISETLLENSKPIVFRLKSVQHIGYRAEFLADVCEVFLDAKEAGVLKRNQLHIAESSKMLHRSFAKIGIIGLVDEITGYQQFRERDALQAFLDKFLLEEFAAWTKTFPDEFFEEIYRLNKWAWTGKTQRPQVIGKYINDLIYDRLGPGVIEELRKRNPHNEKGRRKQKHFQWLTEGIGNPALAQHMYATIGFMRASTNWRDFKSAFYRAYPKKGETLSLPFTE